MSTKIRPEVSKKNEYYVERNRYYELRHFVMQYHDWTRWLREYTFKYPTNDISKGSTDKRYEINPTAEEAEKRDKYLSRIKLIQDCIDEAFMPTMGFGYILRTLTLGRSYDWLITNYDFDMSRERYYKCYRHFYWLLDKKRD